MSQTPPGPVGEPGAQTQPVQATPGSAIPPAASPYAAWAEPQPPQPQPPSSPQVDLTKAQPAWDQPPAPLAPPAPYGQPHPPYAADHPQATTVLVLGILGLVLCAVLAPFAWVMGARVVREIDAGQGRLGGRASANAGRICGIIGSALLALSLLAVVLFVLLAFLGLASAVSTTS